MIFSDIYFLKKALIQAQKAYAQQEVPIGAVLVSNNHILVEGFNMKETDEDPTAHAEMVALRKACEKLKSWRLKETTLYVTCEPCLMSMFKPAPAAPAMNIPRPARPAELEIGKAPIPAKPASAAPIHVTPPSTSRVVHYTDLKTIVAPTFGAAVPAAVPAATPTK